MLQMKNGEQPYVITFDGNDVATVIYNGDIVWTKQPETWLLNANIASTMGSSLNITVPFKSDGIVFSTINIANSGAEKLLRYDTINAYSAAQNKWATSGYRTIVLESPATGNLLTWLQANGTKQ